MPNIKDQSTCDAIAREFTSNGRNKTEAMRTVGYKDGYCDNRGTGIVYTNSRVIEAIARIDAENAAEAGYTIAQCQKEYEEARQLGINLNQPSAVVSAVTGKARLFGFDKQTVVSEHTPDQPEGKEADVLHTLNKEYKLKLAGTSSKPTGAQSGQKQGKGQVRAG